jgi:hypothetical protein
MILTEALTIRYLPELPVLVALLTSKRGRTPAVIPPLISGPPTICTGQRRSTLTCGFALKTFPFWAFSFAANAFHA